VPVEMLQFILKVLLKQNLCCASQFPLIAGCCNSSYLQLDEPSIIGRTLSLIVATLVNNGF